MDREHAARLRKMLEQVNPSLRTEGLEAPLESLGEPAEESQLEVRRGDPANLENEVALEALDVLRRGNEVDGEQQFVLEAIVMPYHRPVVDVVDDYIVASQLTGQWRKLADEGLRPWIKERVRSIGRINVPHLPSLPYAGTGFVVGDGLLMTNRHVASIFAQGLGTRQLHFQTGQTAAVDFYHENGKSTSESLKVEKVVMIHPWWDMALLKVQGLSADRTPLTLDTADPATLQDREVVVIGYPGYDPTGDEEFQRIQNRIFRGLYYIKRLQPGLLKLREQTGSYDRMVEAITHDCSTLGGNSGSAVIDLASGRVVGLHFAGAYLVANYAVPSYDLAQDSRVVDSGVKFEGRLDPRDDFYGPIWRQTDGNESTAAGADSAGPSVQSPKAPQTPCPSSVTPQPSAIGATASWTIPIHLTVSVGNAMPTAPQVGVQAVVGPVEGLAALRAAPEAPTPNEWFSSASLGASKFEWATALSLALASRLSYDADASVVNTGINAWQLQTCEFVEADDTQCFVASSSIAVLVAFRGTESLGDWLGNLNMISTTRSYGKVHRGFLGAFQVVEAKLRSVLSQFPGRPLLLTGHSLGGALATIAAAEWRREFPVSWIYTFGQPAVGKGGFTNFIESNYAGKFFRFVNDDDIVPRVPPTYRHVGRLLRFDSGGGLIAPIESIITEAIAGGSLASLDAAAGPPMLSEIEFDRLRAQLLEQRARVRAAGLESLEAPVLEGLIPSVSDHAIDRYLAKIAAHAGH